MRNTRITEKKYPSIETLSLIGDKSKMKTVKVNIPKYPYEILIGKGILEQLVIYLKKFDEIHSVSIVSDDTVSKHHLAKLLHILEENGLMTSTLIIKTGEKSKKLAKRPWKN